MNTLFVMQGFAAAGAILMTVSILRSYKKIKAKKDLVGEPTAGSEEALTSENAT